MRILQLITELRPAGAERIVQTLSCGLKAAGHEVTVVSLRPLPSESFVVDKLRAAGIALHSLDMTKATPWRAMRLRKLLREFRPDIVHAHLIHANLLSRLIRLAGVPVVNTVHIAERRSGKGWHFLLDRWTLHRCTVQTCVSRAVAEFLSEKLGSPIQSFPVIQNGIEPPTTLSCEEVTALRTEWGVAPDALLIGSVGRLDWQKGYDRLLGVMFELDRQLAEIRNSKLEIRNGEEQGSETYANVGARSCGRTSVSEETPPCGMGRGEVFVRPSACMRTPTLHLAALHSAGSPHSPPPPITEHRSPITPLPASSPLQPNSLQPSAFPWTLVLLGEGPERARLERQAQDLGLRNIVVRLPGFRPDADRAMGAFDLFVMPSRYEGFGLTLIEAMCHGLPIIASDADSLPELLEGYDRGQIVSFDPGHETEAAAAILQELSEATANVGVRQQADGRTSVPHQTSPLAFIPSPINIVESATATFRAPPPPPSPITDHRSPITPLPASSPLQPDSLQPSASPWPFSAARMTADYLHLYEGLLAAPPGRFHHEGHEGHEGKPKIKENALTTNHANYANNAPLRGEVLNPKHIRHPLSAIPPCGTSPNSPLAGKSEIRNPKAQTKCLDEY